LLLILVLPLAASPGFAADTKSEAGQSLRRGAGFFASEVATEGGYVWRYSSDLKFRQGEGVAGPLTIWNQPPGTPAVGQAFLDAFAATNDRFYLDAARAAGGALVQGQLQSGGWFYRAELDPARRREFRYRVDETAAGQTRKRSTRAAESGWDEWKKHAHDDNRTILDDDVTPSAVRFLAHLDRTLGFRDQAIHETVLYALESLLKAQYPIGAWSHNYDSLPGSHPDPGRYPVLSASLPESWSRTWTKDFNGCYSINDRVTLNMIRTMLAAWEVYHDDRYRASAGRGGEFLIRAQLPEPQPAWAQQYDRQMHPVWDRQFEPPAVTGLESQDALEVLLVLARTTGEKRFLAPIPRALAYLKSLRLGDGRLARFYELGTSRPLYFTRDYQITYNGDDVPDHYGFRFPSRLDAIAAEYSRLRSRAAPPEGEARPGKVTPDLEAAVRAIIAGQDRRGAWTEPGTVRDPAGRKTAPGGGIIQSETFLKNMQTLSEFLTRIKD
jgi:hypothetical protein